jgi:hypothetical protein
MVTSPVVNYFRSWARWGKDMSEHLPRNFSKNDLVPPTWDRLSLGIILVCVGLVEMLGKERARVCDGPPRVGLLGGEDA